MTELTTPSRFLRDRLIAAATGLRKDHETATLNLAEAEQDVAAARQLLAEAEAHRDRQRAEVDTIGAEIAWCEQQAARTAPAYDPDAALAATGLMPRDDPRDRRATCAEMGCTSCLGCDGCPCHTPDADLPFTVVQAPADVVAALTGGHPVVPGDPVVAAHGPSTTGPLNPTMTVPDTGTAPAPLPPAAPTVEPRHAKPRPRDRQRGSRLTGPFRALTRTPDDEQDGGDRG